MILQALNRYYEILASDPESDIAPPGYSKVGVNFALNLSPDGVLLDVFPLLQTVRRGNQTLDVPQRLTVPEFVKRSSGVSANFMCDNAAYVLGLSEKSATDPHYARKRFDAFRQLNLDVLQEADCPEARATMAFLQRYTPEELQQHPVMVPYLEEILKGRNLVFRVNGREGYAHDAPAIRAAWEAHKAKMTGAYVGQCLVTGEIAPIARVHANTKGVADSNPTGATLVGFNAPAYESYNRSKGQGLNSPVSEKAAFAYTTTLNYLLSPENPNRKFTVGDATVVYWAESPDRRYADLFASLFEPAADDDLDETPTRDRSAENHLAGIARRVRRGEALDESQLMKGMDPFTRFYVLGLSPNAARLAVRFFYTDPFHKTVRKIMQHYADLQIEKEFSNQPTWISLRQILFETVSKKATNPRVAPLLVGSVFRSIFSGAPYPAALYNAVMTRIRVDTDDKARRISKINYIRAAVIKAYLTRKYRHSNQTQFTEVLCMSLNEQTTNKAYLLGRLFAVLEKAQQDANPGINATIKDRYYTAACASPASVFPVLLRLAQHHMAKAEYGYSSDRRIQDILNRMEMDETAFPSHLTLDEQGIFVLGYYHQRNALYIPKNAKKTTEINTNAEEN